MLKYWSLILILFVATPLARSAELCGAPWPLWEEFARTHIQTDGRVIDYDAGSISTSEGQSYALFFSLVAGDKKHFDSILKWTNDNLAQGDLSIHLPAWKWGKHSNGTWQILDMNPASDADLWIAYSLFHAAAIWKQASYLDLASALLKNISEREVAVLPGLGSMLLPAPYGFALDTETWRLNPSYLPVQLLRYFSTVDKHGAWNEIALNTARLISATSNRRLVPDWVLYGTQKGFQLDPEQGKYSSYDAIRVYLWWAMLNHRDPLFESLRPYVTGAAQLVPKMPLPERINVSDGTMSGQAPSGFAAALTPYYLILYGYQKTTPDSLGEGAGNYTFNTTAATTANITAKAITVAATAANKTYDATANAAATLSSTGVMAGDTVNFAGIRATFANKNVGNLKAVQVLGITASGLDAGNYTFNNLDNMATTTANITPATLTVTTNPATRFFGLPNPAFSGNVTGFVNGETLTTATTGTETFSTPATQTSLVGSYAINGSGLTANNGNYNFVQVAGNATALTVKPGTLPQPVVNVIAQLDSLLTAFNSNGSAGQSGISTTNGRLPSGSGLSLQILGDGIKLPE